MQDSFDKIKNFCLTYKRYIGACGLFIAFVIVLEFSNSTGLKKQMDAGDTEAMVSEIAEGTEITEITEDKSTFVFQDTFDVDSDEEMKTLLSTYYKAYTDNDVAALEKVAYPISDNEKSYIAVVSKYYDKIEKLTYYSKPAAQKDAYFVSVENEISFDGVKTKAPALDFFYVQKDENGKLYINNAYSIFNLNFMDNEVNSDVYSLVQQYMQQPDFVKLQQKVQAAYDEALAKDSDLTGVIQKTLDSAIKKWSSELQSSALEEETTETTESTEKTEEDNKDSDKKENDKKDDDKKNEDKDKKEEVKETEQKEETKNEQKPQKSTVKVKDIVNVRKAASTDSDQIGQFLPGAELKKLGEEGDWTIIEFQGGKGYVKTEFLE